MKRNCQKIVLINQSELEELHFLISVKRLDNNSLKYILDVYSKYVKGKTLFLKNKSKTYYYDKIINNYKFYSYLKTTKINHPMISFILKDDIKKIYLFIDRVKENKSNAQILDESFLERIAITFINMLQDKNLKFLGLKSFFLLLLNNNNESYKICLLNKLDDIFNSLKNEDKIIFIKQFINFIYLKVDINSINGCLCVNNKINISLEAMNNYNSVRKQNDNNENQLNFFLPKDMTKVKTKFLSYVSFEIFNKIEGKYNKDLFMFLEKYSHDLIKSFELKNGEKCTKLFDKYIDGLISVYSICDYVYELSNEIPFRLNNKLFVYLYLVFLSNQIDKKISLHLEFLQNINDDKIKKLTQIQLYNKEHFINIFLKRYIDNDNYIDKSIVDTDEAQTYSFCKDILIVIYSYICDLVQGQSMSISISIKDPIKLNSDNLISNKLNYNESFNKIITELDVKNNNHKLGIILFVNFIFNASLDEAIQKKLIDEHIMKNINYIKDYPSLLPMIECFLRFIFQDKNEKLKIYKKRNYGYDILIVMLLSIYSSGESNDDLLADIFYYFQNEKFNNINIINLNKALLLKIIEKSENSNLIFNENISYLLYKNDKMKEKIIKIYESLQGKITKVVENMLFLIMTYLYVFTTNSLQKIISMSDGFKQFFTHPSEVFSFLYKDIITSKEIQMKSKNKDFIQIFESCIIYLISRQKNLIYFSFPYTGIPLNEKYPLIIIKPHPEKLFSKGDENKDIINNKIIGIENKNFKYKLCGIMLLNKENIFLTAYYDFINNLWYQVINEQIECIKEKNIIAILKNNKNIFAYMFYTYFNLEYSNLNLKIFEGEKVNYSKIDSKYFDNFIQLINRTNKINKSNSNFMYRIFMNEKNLLSFKNYLVDIDKNKVGTIHKKKFLIDCLEKIILSHEVNDELKDLALNCKLILQKLIRKV